MSSTSVFKNLAERVRQWAKKLSLQSKLAILFSVLLFLTPTSLALLSVYSTNQKNHAKSYLDLTLYDMGGNSIVAEEGYADDASLKSLLGMFYSIARSDDPISHIPSGHEDDPYVRADLTLNGKHAEWLCYFSTEDTGGYCLDQNGRAYTIHPTVNESFLASEYAEDFYPSATPPMLTSLGGDQFLPESMSWSYRNCRQETMAAKDQKTLPPSVVYDVSGELDLHFAQDPDTCRIVIKNDTALVFDGSLEEFSPITASPDTVLRVVISAQWLPRPERNYSGSVRYEFYARIHNRAQFSVHTDTAVCGELLVISCANVTDLTRLQLIDKNEIGLPKPTFYQDGEIVRAILLVPSFMPTNQLAFDVVYGATTQSFVLPVTQKEPPATYTFLAKPETILLATNAQAASELLLNRLSALPDTPPYFRGNFLNPTDYGMTLGYRHGSYLYLSDEQTEPITAFGSEFRALKSGVTIRALQNGRVVDIGESEFLGHFAVVDHGCGLFSWYAHLGSVDVSLGTVLKTGDPIGKSGSAGVSNGEGVLILTSTKNAFFDPAVLIGKTLPLTLFEEDPAEQT